MALAMLALTGCGARKNNRQPLENQTWHDVYMPVKVNLESPAQMGFSARATMVRDSAINISMRILGMEVAVANADRDSVWFVDKYHKIFFAESKAKLLGEHDMDLVAIQNLILGIRPGQPDKVDFGLPGGAEATVTFADFVETPAGIAAENVTVKAPLPRKGEVRASLRWNLPDAKWNTGRTVNFKLPDGYRQITAADLLKMLKSF